MRGMSQERTGSIWIGCCRRIFWQGNVYRDVMVFSVTAVSKTATLMNQWCPQRLSQTLLLHSVHSAPDDASNDDKAECIDKMWDPSYTKIFIIRLYSDWFRDLWIHWAIMRLRVPKTGGTFLRECSSHWVRRETSCNSSPVAHLAKQTGSWDTVLQMILSSPQQMFTSSQIRFYDCESMCQKSILPKNKRAFRGP